MKVFLVEVFVVTVFSGLMTGLMWVSGAGSPTAYEFLLLMFIGQILMNKEDRE